MITFLRKLRSTNWRERIDVRDSLETARQRLAVMLGGFVSGLFKDRTAKALTGSLCVHLGLAIWALCSMSQTESRVREATLITNWADTNDADSVEFPFVASPIEIAVHDVASGGSTGSLLTSLPPMPNVENPLEATSSDQLSDNGASDKELMAAISQALSARGGEHFGKGKGRGIGNGVGDGKRYFSVPSDAKSFVFVLDCSLSMNHPHDGEAKTRFRKLKLELIQSISSLRADQEFFIVFFNHDAIPMPADRLVPAILENQQRYLHWVQQVEASGDTDPTAALQIALRMRPDVIYFLTDGCFSRDANDIVQSISQNQTAIHTFSFEQPLTDKQRDGIELLRKKKTSAALLKMGEATFRRTREIYTAEQVMQQLAEHNRGKFHVIR